MYYMLERLFEQKMAIKTFFNDPIDKTIKELTNAEWELIDELINILAPLEQATQYMSGDKYSSMSLMIAVFSGLIVRLKQLKITKPSLKTIRDNIINSLKTRFLQIEDNEYSTFASVLDPRIKDTCFLNSDKKRLATKKVLEKLEEFYELNQSNLIVENSVNVSPDKEPNSKRPRFDLWDFVTEQQEERYSEKNSVAVELDNYLKVKILKK